MILYDSKMVKAEIDFDDVWIGLALTLLFMLIACTA